MSKNGWTSLGSILEKQFTREAICSRPQSMKTGFRQLDNILGGGLNPGLTVLGGSTGLGKSTFALQLAEQVSESGRGIPVLYFSLEMSAQWIAAKAISRRYFQRVRGGGGRALTANELLNPETAQRLSEREWREIGEIRADVTRNQGLYIIEGALSARQISDMVQSFLSERSREKGGGMPPLVIVDYLQILLPSTPVKASPGSGKQVIEESLQIMVELAQAQVPIILISSLNRNSYDRPMQRDAFKETGSIEYSADVLLGLQYCACRDAGGSKWDISEEENKSPRNVEISVLKQRYGGSGRAIKFSYYANYDYFEEADAPAPPALTGPGSASASANMFSLGQQPAPVEKSEPFYINNTKLADEIRRGVPAEKRLSCTVFKGTVTEYQLSAPLSCSDCNVADAVYTLYKSGRRQFTSGQVLRVLSGDKRQTITEQKKREITASIDRLMDVYLEIDCAAEMQARAPETAGEVQTIAGSFLSAEKIGRDKYYFDRATPVLPMPLYQYGELTKQMIRFPNQLLAVYDGDKKITDTMETISLKRFLIRRLEIIRHPTPARGGAASGLKRSGMRVISFQETGEIFSKIGVSPADYKSKPVSAWNHKCRNIYQTVTKILDYYQQIGYIAGYRQTSTSIELPEKDNIADPWTLPWPEHPVRPNRQTAE